jgi:quercetin dioxygenase-like cupin family protein
MTHLSRVRRIVWHMSQQTIQRKQLLNAVMGSRHITSADVREIRMEAGQQGGRHVHPCAVLGYIAEGTAMYEVEGQPVQTLPAGSAFYEPADVVIANFGNASDTEPMKFVAFYLLDGEQELIRMLPPR